MDGARFRIPACLIRSSKMRLKTSSRKPKNRSMPRRDLERCYAEQSACAELLRAGHPDRQGLTHALYDWFAEAVLRGDGEPTERPSMPEAQTESRVAKTP